MWVYTLISTIIGACALILSVYNFWYSRHAPVRERQEKLRSELKKTLQRMGQCQFSSMAMRIMNGEMPTEAHFNEVTKFYELLCTKKKDYIAPAPDDMRRLIDKVDSVAKALFLLKADPSRDEDLLDLKVLVTEMRHQIGFFIDGLTDLEKHSFATRRQIRQFRRSV